MTLTNDERKALHRLLADTPDYDETQARGYAERLVQAGFALRRGTDEQRAALQ